MVLNLILTKIKMNQRKRFPFMKYNLAENNVQGAEIVNLQYLSKTVLIGKQFAKKSGEIKNIKMQYSAEQRYAPYPREWNAIEKTVIEKTSSLLPELVKTDVKPMVSLIGKDIFELLSKSVASFGDQSLFLDNLVFNSQGLINTRGTIQAILNKSDLSTYDKFKIACQYFIGREEIAQLFKNLSWHSLKMYFRYKDKCEYLSCNDSCIAIYFWVWHIKTERDLLIKIKKSLKIKSIAPQFAFDEKKKDSAIKDLYLWALKNGNEIAVQFIYDNFISNNSQKDSILLEHISYVGFHYNSTNIILYFISNINEGKLSTWFLHLAVGVLREMARQTRWHNTFLHIFINLHRRNSFEYIHYVRLLKELVQVAFDIALTGNNTKPYEELIEKYLDIVPHTIIAHLILEDCGYYSLILEKSFSLRNWDLTCLLLEISRKYLKTKQQFLMKHLQFTTDVSLFHMAICKADVIFIDKVLDYYLEEKENRLSIKRWIFNVYAYQACDFYIVTGKESRLHRFMKWASEFCADGKIEDFKSCIPFVLDKKTIKKILFGLEENNYENTFLNYLKNFFYVNCKVQFCSYMRNLCPFKYTEKILLWCFSDPKDVSNYKNLICTVDNDQPENFFYANIKQWIMNSKLDNVEKLIDWCSTPNDEVEKLKNKLREDTDITNLYYKHVNLRQFLQYIEENN